MLDHENTLIDHRFGWMLATQALLFAALGAFWDKDTFVQVTIATVGVASTLSIWRGLWLANTSIGNLVTDWETFEKGHKQEAKDLPPLFGLERMSSRGAQLFFPWIAVPFVILVAWGAVLVRVLDPFDWWSDSVQALV
jgi:hypothetical protein